MAIKLTTPLSEDSLRKLRAGDRVLITGVIYTARDAAHRRMAELIESGRELPVDLSGQVLYYVGPTPPQAGMATGSAGPTTASRMDRYTPGLLAATGLKAVIGKGERGAGVMESLRENGAVYLAAVGGAGALIAQTIRKADPVAWPELGTEAIFRFEVEDFPAIVVLDLEGGNLYESGRSSYRK
jgi:fumarate hydratase subunit beta